MQPGDTVSTVWHVDVPLSAATGSYYLVGSASYQRKPGKSQPVGYAGGFSRSTLGEALTAALDPGFIGLGAGDSKDTTLRISNNAARDVTVGWSYIAGPATNPAFTLQPSTGTLTVPAGGTASATLTASAAQNAAGAGPGPARVDLTATSPGEADTRIGSVELNVIWYPGAAQSLAATYNNKGSPTTTTRSRERSTAARPATRRRDWPQPASAGARPSTTTGRRSSGPTCRPASPTTPRPTAR